MSEDQWVPLSVRQGRAQPFEPVTGVPDFLRRYLYNWIVKASSVNDGAPVGVVALKLRLDLPQREYLDSPGTEIVSYLDYQPRFDDSVVFDVIDCLLFHRFGDSLAMEFILEEAGHVLTVAPDKKRLMERLDPSLLEQYKNVTSPQDKASDHLHKAWTLTFGRDPDPSQGWGEAIKAVETLLAPVVSPDDTKATLGKMTNALRSAPERWTCHLPDRAYKKDGVEKTKHGTEALADVLAMIGYQPDRHGSSQSAPAAPTTARSMVLLATTVVGWLRDDVLQRVDSAPDQ